MTARSSFAIPCARAAAAVALIAATGAQGCGILGPDALDDWTFLGLDGQGVLTVHQTPWGLYAGTRDAGVFRYDGDTTWIPLGHGHALVKTIAFVEGNEPSLLIGVGPNSRSSIELTEAAVFRSNDSGHSWTPSDSGLASESGTPNWASSLAADPLTDLVYFGSTSDVFRSDDRGATWAPVFGDGTRKIANGTRIVLDPSRPGRVWRAGIDAFGVGHAYRSDDSGNTWVLSFDFENVELGVSDVLPDPTVAGRVWIAGDGGVARSNDDGDTWEPSLRKVGQMFDLLVVEGRVVAAGSQWPPDVRPKTPRLEVHQFRSGAWERVSVPDDIVRMTHRGTATVDDEGRLVVGTEGTGVWRLERLP